ncbi:MAG: YqgE/AlgH family protein [Steroidobacterales bacterium]
MTREPPGRQPGYNERMAEGDYLCNQLLIAMPGMADPNFTQTVTLICEHNAGGALGIIINRPLPMTLDEVFAQLALDNRDSGLGERIVLKGGPVQTDRGFVVHRAGGTWDSTLKVSDDIHVTTSRDVLAALASGTGPRDAFVALGYAGWQAGQLEEEIRANAWLNVPASDTIVFSLPFEDRWHAAGRLLGIELNRLGSAAGHA